MIIVRGRYVPTPKGDLHRGIVGLALLTWLTVRHGAAASLGAAKIVSGYARHQERQRG